MTTTPDLVAFLLAEIAKDEQVALAATQGNKSYPRWSAEPNMTLEKGCRCLSCWEPTGSWDVYPIDGPDCVDHGCFHTMTIWQGDAEHIARHDPARVLADCAAKRRIVQYAVAARSHADRAKEMGWPHEVHQAAAVAYEDVVRLLAVPYADHPDYRPEWKP